MLINAKLGLKMKILKFLGIEPKVTQKGSHKKDFGFTSCRSLGNVDFETVFTNCLRLNTFQIWLSKQIKTFSNFKTSQNHPKSSFFRFQKNQGKIEI